MTDLFFTTSKPSIIKVKEEDRRFKKFNDKPLEIKEEYVLDRNSLSIIPIDYKISIKDIDKLFKTIDEQREYIETQKAIIEKQKLIIQKQKRI